jgi:dihydrolipoamide dehydrogenase
MCCVVLCCGLLCQVASVGLSEEEAKAKGLNYKTGKFSFMANSRARAVNDTEGMVRYTSPQPGV